MVACNAITGVDDLRLKNTDESTTPSSGNYQGVKRPLMKDGSKAVSDIPIVQGRDALVRVWVSLDAAYNNLPVTAQLFIGASTPPIEVKKSLTESTEENLDSTINFEVPGAELKVATTYRI